MNLKNTPYNLKIKKRYFDAIVNGTKLYEIRSTPYLNEFQKLWCEGSNQTLTVKLGKPELLTPAHVGYFSTELWWDSFCFGYVYSRQCWFYPILEKGKIENAKH
ncbi:MAG: ASCH domain-containing protein [Mycoplasmataceae bacterium]|jgi:hypothetical protein|nr:ASCH domain-containing protein [Mycoplasmataceae bacterium]